MLTKNSNVTVKFTGVDFGEYSLRQYRYAKDYYKVAQDEMQKLEDN